MKRVTRFFPILIMLIIVFLIVIMNDMEEKEKYNKFTSYDYTGFVVPDNNEAITDDKIDLLFKTAEKSNVILEKEIYNEKNDSVELYLATDNLYELYQDKLSMQKLNKKHDLSFMATYQSKSSDQSFYIPDFLNNDRFTFNKSEAMKANNVYRYGTYTLYYQDMQDYENFMNKAEDILKTDKDSLRSDTWGQFDEKTDLIFYSIIGFIIFFILFYFLIILFQLYRETKKIGCLLLLGFSKKDIIKIMIKKIILYMIVASILSVLFCMFILPNMKGSLLFDLFLMEVLIIFLTIFLAYMALTVIQKYTNVSNILKKESVLDKISKICLFTNCIIVGGIILFIISLLPLIQSSSQSVKNLKNSDLLMDYAVFPRINVENADYEQDQKYLLFYKELAKNDIEHIYVKFADYLEQESSFNEETEIKGDYFRIATVDVNYLEKYDLSYYDKYGNAIDIPEVDKEYHLLPQSKKAYTDNLKNRVQERFNGYGFSESVEIYYYEDQVFDTYDVFSGVDKVESPIFRVINENYPYTYFESRTGIDIAGTGMSTGLKFDISKDEKLFHSKLLDCIKKAGLQEVLKESNFVSYQDYYSDEITKLKETNSIFYSGMILSIILYLVLVIQTFILYVESKMDEILVKLLIGFSKKEIFKKVFYWNIGISLIPIAGILSYSLVSQNENFSLILLVCGSFIIFDIILLIAIVKMIKFNKIYTKIKGG